MKPYNAVNAQKMQLCTDMWPFMVTFLFLHAQVCELGAFENKSNIKHCLETKITNAVSCLLTQKLLTSVSLIFTIRLYFILYDPLALVVMRMWNFVCWSMLIHGWYTGHDLTPFVKVQTSKRPCPSSHSFSVLLLHTLSFLYLEGTNISHQQCKLYFLLSCSFNLDLQIVRSNPSFFYLFCSIFTWLIF